MLSWPYAHLLINHFPVVLTGCRRRGHLHGVSRRENHSRSASPQAAATAAWTPARRGSRKDGLNEALSVPVFGGVVDATLLSPLTTTNKREPMLRFSSFASP